MGRVVWDEGFTRVRVTDPTFAAMNNPSTKERGIPLPYSSRSDSDYSERNSVERDSEYSGRRHIHPEHDRKRYYSG